MTIDRSVEQGILKEGHKHSRRMEAKGQQPSKLTKRGVAAVVAATALGVATTEATLHPLEKAAGVMKDMFGQNSDIKTYPFQEIDSLGEFKKQVESQLSVGQEVTVADLNIAVPEGTSLKIRYYAKTLPQDEDNPTGGIAVEIPEGQMLHIKDAATVRGELVDPNDPISDVWYAVNLDIFDLPGYGYISASSFTRSAVTPQNHETVKISQLNENGSLYFNQGGQSRLIGEVQK